MRATGYGHQRWVSIKIEVSYHIVIGVDSLLKS